MEEFLDFLQSFVILLSKIMQGGKQYSVKFRNAIRNILSTQPRKVKHLVKVGCSSGTNKCFTKNVDQRSAAATRSSSARPTNAAKCSKTLGGTTCNCVELLEVVCLFHGTEYLGPVGEVGARPGLGRRDEILVVRHQQVLVQARGVGRDVFLSLIHI